MMDCRNIVLGALLHDIGKAIIKNNHNLHVHNPNKDINKLRELKDILLDVLSENDFIWHSIIYHHSPNKSTHKELLEIIKIADEEASELRLEEEEKEKEWKIKIIYPWSILTEKEKYVKAYGLLDLEEEILTENPINLNEYRKIWVEKYQDNFIKELKEAIKIKDPDLILAIIYKWLYFYPETAGYKNINLFSLAFHLKTTAMLADLYCKYYKERKEIYIVTIDFVGTHRTIVSFLRKKKEFAEEGEYLKKVNYLSRFVDCLTAYVTRKILEIANSYTTNILYISGSSAKVIIALNNSEKEKIEKFIDSLNRKLFELSLGNSFIHVYFKKITNVEKGKLLEKIVEIAFSENKKELMEIEEEKLKKQLELSSILYEKNIQEIFNKIRDLIKQRLEKLLNKEKIIIMPKDIGFDEEEPLIIPYEFILKLEKLEKHQKKLIFNNTSKIFIYLESGRLRNISIDEIKNISEKTKKVGFLKIDGDQIGTLFGKLLHKIIPGKIKELFKKEDVKRTTALLILRLSELLSFMFKYRMLRIAEELNKNPNDRAISIVYNSGDELLAIGDIELLKEFYEKFLEEKEKLLLNIIKTSSAFIYTHYKYPFNFAYEIIKDLPDEIKRSKENYYKIKELLDELDEKEKYKEAFRLYTEMEDGILFLKGKILHKNYRKFKNKIEIVDKLKKIPRTRIANMEMIIERILKELEEGKASAVVSLVYYAAEEYKEYFNELIEDIKKKFNISDKENLEKTKERLYYWLSIFDYVKTITRS